MTNLEKAIQEMKRAYEVYFIRCKEIESDKMPAGVLDGHNSEYKEASIILHKKIKDIEKKYDVKVSNEDFSLQEAYEIKKKVYGEI